MKTPREYAFDYLKNRDFNVLTNIMIDHLNEIDVLVAKRGVRTRFTLVPVIDEIIRKWVKFTKLVNKKIEKEEDKIVPTGFLKSLKRHRPSVYEVYMDTKIKMDFAAVKRTEKSNGKI